MIYYVNQNAAPNGDGSQTRPFRHIQQAALVALPGDEVLVAPGIYREEVDPINAGTERNPIVYRSQVPLGAVITGAEIVKGWEPYQGDTWLLALPNAFFGTHNPYTTRVFGDWLDGHVHAHTGEVFLNGKSLYEKETLDAVLNPEFFNLSWDREFTKHTWYTEQSTEAEETLIYANFQGKNPNEELVEITVRPHCFYPSKEHVNYITLSGFTVTKAATQWAPPTAVQEGMIGPHWSKGWVIENCDISESKCSGISLGKYFQQHNNNKWSVYKYKDGAQTQRDCSLIAQLDGWSKETVGSHTVRNCEIHDCGQTGIVGNLGCVFSTIENCHIHHINTKGNLSGAEIGGIKFHAAIDVTIRNSHFHHCTRGIWLDWQTQGSRVSGCLFHDNCLPRDYLLENGGQPGLALGEDLFIEIAHGPCLVDNNVLLSERAVKLPTQGVAFVHNLIAGAITAVGRGVKNGTTEKFDSTRYTPIHRPHSTDITGFMSILHGDVRFYNNVFVQPAVRPALAKLCAPLQGPNCPEKQWDDFNLTAGTVPYSGYMTEETWRGYFEGYCGEGAESGRDKYYMPLPVWSAGNVYFNGAQPCDMEENPLVDTQHHITLTLTEEEGGVHLLSDFTAYLPEVPMISSDTLGLAFEPEQRFETPAGEDIRFDTDFYGRKRETVVPGPFCR